MTPLSFFRGGASNLLRFLCNQLASQLVSRVLYSRFEKRELASPVLFIQEPSTSSISTILTIFGATPNLAPSGGSGSLMSAGAASFFPCGAAEWREGCRILITESSLAGAWRTSEDSAPTQRGEHVPASDPSPAARLKRQVVRRMRCRLSRVRPTLRATPIPAPRGSLSLADARSFEHRRSSRLRIEVRTRGRDRWDMRSHG